MIHDPSSLPTCLAEISDQVILVRLPCQPSNIHRPRNDVGISSNAILPLTADVLGLAKRIGHVIDNTFQSGDTRGRNQYGVSRMTITLTDLQIDSRLVLLEVYKDILVFNSKHSFE